MPFGMICNASMTIYNMRISWSFVQLHPVSPTASIAARRSLTCINTLFGCALLLLRCRRPINIHEAVVSCHSRWSGHVDLGARLHALLSELHKLFECGVQPGLGVGLKSQRWQVDLCKATEWGLVHWKGVEAGGIGVHVFGSVTLQFLNLGTGVGFEVVGTVVRVESRRFAIVRLDARTIGRADLDFGELPWSTLQAAVPFITDPVSI